MTTYTLEELSAVVEQDARSRRQQLTDLHAALHKAFADIENAQLSANERANAFRKMADHPSVRALRRAVIRCPRLNCPTQEILAEIYEVPDDGADFSYLVVPTSTGLKKGADAGWADSVTRLRGGQCRRCPGTIEYRIADADFSS